jgi:UTP--glucose-1-phosphate uridylyltransferase
VPVKAVILAAGYGTRFLPATKSVPKELLPLLDKPAIDFLVEELVASGIEDILLVTSRRKKALEDHLDREIELEEVLAGKEEKSRKIAPPKARFFFTRQMEMRGTGHALLQARPFIGPEPFIVAYPDDIHVGDPPLAAQLIQRHRETGCAVLATLHEPPNMRRYALLDLDPDGTHVRSIVEKPPKGSEPSGEASIGRYLYLPEIFDYLEEGYRRHTEGEYYHTYAVNRLAADGKVVFRRVEGRRYDLGAPDSYLEAFADYVRKFPEYEKILRGRFG